MGSPEPVREGDDPRILVVGLGYVGLPLAIALARHFPTTGLDVDAGRIAELRAGRDRTGEVEPETLAASRLALAAAPEDCAPADIYIVTVPTPVDAANVPDLGIVRRATETVAQMLDASRRPIIVYESTVYPGVTEEICGPLIERVSGLARGRDFFLGYSPERINPGDREHTVDRITKVVAGESPEITERLCAIYGRITSGGTFAAKSIAVAEAAKVIENTQRDINIAFMNEITRIFGGMGLSIWDVLAAARTKWNFLGFEPGLVGGHCIGVDPYYLSHRATQLGHYPQVILAGRQTNDTMAAWIAREVHYTCRNPSGDVLVLGLTFKENVPDLRNSKVIDLVRELEALGHRVTLHDPLADAEEAKREYGVTLARDALAGRYDLVVGAVPHAAYKALDGAALAGLLRPDGLLADVKRLWSDETKRTAGARCWSL